ARSRRARRAGTSTITISSSAPAAAATRATTASPSAPGTTCAASTRAACGPGARRRTPSPGSSAAARDSRRCSRWRATVTWRRVPPCKEYAYAGREHGHRDAHAHRARLVAERHRVSPRRHEHRTEGNVCAVERRRPVVDVRPPARVIGVRVHQIAAGPRDDAPGGHGGSLSDGRRLASPVTHDRRAAGPTGAY